MSENHPKTGLTVKVNYFVKRKDISIPAVKKLVKVVCEQLSLSNAGISITLVSDSQIKKLNKRFLGSNRVTDCLSFDLSDNTNPCRKNKQVKVFEIVVNALLARREARRRGHTAEAELALYITHSLLHQLGFNDLKPRQAEKMHQKEDEILQKLGYNSVYKH